MSAPADETLYGISCFGHDAGLAVVRGDQIVFAAHAERYSGIKNDAFLNEALIDDALRVAGPPERIVFHERPWRTRVRHAWSGQWRAAFSPSPITHIRSFRTFADVPLATVGHHEAHAAGGLFTAPFDEAAVVVVDGIGEWDTVSVWHAHNGRLKRIFAQHYPHSLGLFYAAFTQRCGLKPNEEESILMAMAALGRPTHRDAIELEFVRLARAPHFRLKRNLHRGLGAWRPDWTEPETIAASVQAIAEDVLLGLMAWVAQTVPSRNLVFSGGLALNCVVNEKLCRSSLFERIWIMPNPGDAGNALGAALAFGKRRVHWTGPYLGHDLARRPALDGAIAALLERGVVGLAHGRAEYGPRALGNRSLLADPRDLQIKERVNQIKRREPFRPFAPVVVAELADEYFDLPQPSSPYMQWTARCRFPERFPGICHVDGSSRVQTVDASQNPSLHRLLQAFHARTGCPMLLNTSLNVKGKPFVNNRGDAQAFERETGIEVF
ncbi:carbamoyltransferase [Paraburkholderia sp. Clong3]|uniref:carbamoyltransferase family protein n=1 Tax=Paraburkholderia sp. Clong3 TaxID=2991061 RepID=UPI003D21FF84